MKSERDFIVPFLNLKLGFHEFDFQVDDTFFEDREYAIVHKGNVNVKLVLEKKETMMIGEFSIEGVVFSECGRCTEDIEVEIDGEYKLIFKLSTEESDDEMLIVLSPEAFEMDLRDIIYEFITVSLPTRLVHDSKEECNQEMLEILSKYQLVQTGKRHDDEEEEEDDDDESFDFDGDSDEDNDDDWDDDNEEKEDDDDKDGPIDPRWAALINLN